MGGFIRQVDFNSGNRIPRHDDRWGNGLEQSAEGQVCNRRTGKDRARVPDITALTAQSRAVLKCRGNCISRERVLCLRRKSRHGNPHPLQHETDAYDGTD